LQIADFHHLQFAICNDPKENTMATSIPAVQVDTIIFACEAGIGSSLMGVNALKKKLKAAGLTVSVVHKPVRSVPASAKVVVVHKGLADFARKQAPNAVVVSFSQFLNDPVFDKLVQALKSGDEILEAR
jgi:mannitol-specific phosphotransferase system IIBC component